MRDAILDAKRRLRRELLALRRAVPAVDAAAASDAATAHLLAQPELQGARRVALYAARPGELGTRGLFEALRARGVACWLPRVRQQGLEFAATDRWEELEPGAHGVSEPSSALPAVRLVDADLVVVPGVGFDRSGQRLGRGGGHYDRALAGAPRVWAVGWAHVCQVVDALPHGSHDRPVHAIVTALGVRRITE